MHLDGSTGRPRRGANPRSTSGPRSRQRLRSTALSTIAFVTGCLGVIGLSGCGHAPGRSPAFPLELPSVGHGISVERGGDTLVLVYDVRSHDGPWRHEVVVDGDRFSERRTHLEGRGTFTFGEDAFGPWLHVGDGPVRAADAIWRREARTHAVIYGLRFLAHHDAHESVYIPRTDGAWDYVYRAPGSRTIAFLVAAEGDRSEPRAWDTIDDVGRLVACDDVRWVDVGPRRRAPATATCSAIDGTGGRSLVSYHRLVSARLVAEAPSWAAPRGGRAQAPCLAQTVEVPITDETSPSLNAVAANGTETALLLDSGAAHSYLDEDVARSMGVVPTGDVPIHGAPPWLPVETSWVGVIDRIIIGGIPIDGARVLVMPGLRRIAGVGGLLGADFFRRFVVDVDAPARVVRLWPEDRFERPEDAAGFFMRGHEDLPRINGLVRGVERGALVLDTGARVRLVVHAPRMSVARPRHRGSDTGPAITEGGRTPDYATSVDGLVLGPFQFPQMPAWGRDRNREAMGGGVARVGMGTMRHLRVMFDFHDRAVYATAGDGYIALSRAGLELDDADDGKGALVTHVVPGSRAYVRGVRAGDTVTAIDGRPITDAISARRGVAEHRGGAIAFIITRAERPRRVNVALLPPPPTASQLLPPHWGSERERDGCGGLSGVARAAR